MQRWNLRGECRGDQGRRRIDWRWWEERQHGGDVDVDGWRGDGDGGARTRITCLVSRLEASAHEGRVGDRCIMLISKVSVCTILTTHTAL